MYKRQVLEAVIGLVTAFDIKADVLVSMALIASVIIGEDFAAGEVAFIMQLGALLEDLTVAKAVSYTHLALRHGVLGLRQRLLGVAAYDVALLAEVAVGVQLRRCLLYTSRCV